LDPSPASHVFKYLEPADRFVRIRTWRPLDADARLPRPTDGLDREGYERAVVEAFVEEVDALEGRAPKGRKGRPADRDLVRALYALVVSVNPELAIERVSLAASTEAVAASTRQEVAAAADRRMRRRAASLAERLRERVVGQDRAIEAVLRAFRRSAAGLDDGRGPRAALLFLGPTGSGKTELARALASELGGDDALLRIDCSEYGEGHEYAKLIGAPPGYVGHTEGGLLTDGIRKRPDAVVLFDEVEKAHSRLHHLLLQVLDDGRITDGQGQTADLTRAFVILTSNTGSDELERARVALGFGQGELDPRATGEIAERALAATFRPEFLGRLDDVVAFRPLAARDAVRIASAKLADLAVRVRRRGARIRQSTAVARWVAERGFSARSGARSIESVIRRDVEAPLAEALLAPPGTTGTTGTAGATGSRKRFALTIRGGRLRIAPDA